MAVEVSPYLLRRLRSLGEVLSGDDKPEEETPADTTGADQEQRTAASGDSGSPHRTPKKDIG